MYLLLVFLPLFSFLVVALLGRLLGRDGAALVSVFLMTATVCLSFFVFYEVTLSKSSIVLNCFDWIDLGFFSVKWSFLFDSLTALMLLVVNLVSLSVHFYSISYMTSDPHLQRFLSYLSVFTFFMLMLVSAGNFLQMFFGWEGVGLASYLLISFWFTRLAANKAAIKAMLVNRIGDIGVVLAMLIIFDVFGSLEYTTVFALIPHLSQLQYNFLTFELGVLDIIGLFLLCGVAGKSAQIGLHIWLPDAMEGPTPVSALIHAATMVTAGVFILVRASIIFEYSSFLLTLMACWGALTALVASTIGVFQNDIKRVIAYSTCSQLGYMVFAAGMSLYFLSFFHLFTHAFFKALLFLGAGSVIHSLSDEQDMRRYGGLVLLLPFSYVVFWIGSLALMGFPFLAGFYSKDFIIEFTFASFRLEAPIVGFMSLMAAFFTAFYSFKIIYLTFLQFPSSYRSYISACHDAPLVVYLPLLLLSGLSIIVGFLFNTLFLGVGSGFWVNSTSFWFNNSIYWEGHFLGLLRLLPLVFSVCGVILAYYVYSMAVFLTISVESSVLNEIFSFFNRKWFFDNVYNDFVLDGFMKASYSIFVRSIDKGLLEFCGPYGLTQLFARLASLASGLQSGLLYHYAFIMLLGLLVLLSMFAFNLLWFYFFEAGFSFVLFFSIVIILIFS